MQRLSRLTLGAIAAFLVCASAAFGQQQPPSEAAALAISANIQAKHMPFGAILVSIRVPDRRGQPADVVLGFDAFEDYITKQPPYFGAVVSTSRCTWLADTGTRWPTIEQNLAQ